MLVCNVVQVCALWNIAVGTNFSFVLCSPGQATFSIYGHLEGAQAPARIGKGMTILRLYYPYDILTYFPSFITVVQKGNVQVCRKLQYSRVYKSRKAIFL